MYDKFDMHIQLTMCSSIASANIRSIRSSLCPMEGSSIGGFRNAGESADDNGERFDREPASILKILKFEVLE